MRKRIKINREGCIGCRRCEFICSLEHSGTYAPWFSRIKIDSDEEICLAKPVTCRNCRERYCMSVCPVEAIEISPVTGIPIVNELQCIGCQECIKACVFNSIWFNKEKNIAYKCDLCSGNPRCIEVCPAQALVLEELEEVSDE